MTECIQTIKTLFGITNPKGYSAEQIEEAKILCGGLPRFLEQFCLEIGASDELQGLQDTFYLPNRFSRHLTEKLYEDYIDFFIENESIYTAAIRKEDVVIENPPVYTNLLGETEWKKASDTISEFLTAIFAFQAVMCLKHNCEEYYCISPDEVYLLDEHFTKRPEVLDEWFCKTEFYESRPNSRISLQYASDDWYHILYSAGDKDDFDEIGAFIKRNFDPL